MQNSVNVKVLQWGRRCLENYLIDIDILTDLLKSEEVVKAPLARSGEASKLLREVANSQLTDFVARTVYERCLFENPGIRSAEIEGRPVSEIADILFNRLTALKDQLSRVADPWKQQFISACEKDITELQIRWSEKWREDCNGKRFFADLHKKVCFKMSVRRFKKRVMAESRAARTENWRAMESLLNGLIAG